MQTFIRLEHLPGPNVFHTNPIEAFGDGLPNLDPTYDYYGPFDTTEEAEDFLRSKGAVQHEDETCEGGSVWDYGNGCEAVVMKLFPPNDMPAPTRKPLVC